MGLGPFGPGAMGSEHARTSYVHISINIHTHQETGLSMLLGGTYCALKCVTNHTDEAPMLIDDEFLLVNATEADGPSDLHFVS